MIDIDPTLLLTMISALAGLAAVYLAYLQYRHMTKEKLEVSHTERPGPAKKTIPIHVPQPLGGAFVRHVLLMLGTGHQPPPREEIHDRANHCAIEGHTHVITTKSFTNMTAQQSVVAFFGDSNLGNAYLGKGKFLRYIPNTDPEYQQILQASELYRLPGNIPNTSQGFIELSDLTEAAPGEGLEALNGIIVADGDSNGDPLTIPNVKKRKQAMDKTYYRDA